jgi:hypothetical protein
MALTWREDRPEAMTAASQSAERPLRSMVTIFSALSSSREVRMRLSRSLCGAGLRADAAAAGFLGIGFLTVLAAVFFACFFAETGIFFAAFALAAGFLLVLEAALRVRA